MKSSLNRATRLASGLSRSYFPFKGVLFALIASADGFSSVLSISGERHRHFSLARLKSTRLHSQQTSIADTIRSTFQREQTDGILKLSSLCSEADINTLIESTLEAVEENNGHVASVLNGFIGACTFIEDKSTGASKACELLEAFEQLEADKEIRPDIVTYALAYNAICRDPNSAELAEIALERGQKISKKIAGSKRRKALAASRRKKVSESCKSVESDLKELLGEDFQVLFESEDAFVINKPSGTSCFHKKTTTAGKAKKGKKSHEQSDISLEDALSICGVPLSTLNPEALGLVHRLDRGTSGCMILAKNDKAHATLLSEFFLRKCEKQYTTIVAPAPPSSIPESGSIEVPVDGRSARSDYRIMRRYGTMAALVNFRTYTGRKHQVRVHAASSDLSSPVLNDDLYGRSERIADIPADVINRHDAKGRFFLHASTLSIPSYGIDCQAPLPNWWKPVLEAIQHASSDN